MPVTPKWEVKQNVFSLESAFTTVKLSCMPHARHGAYQNDNTHKEEEKDTFLHRDAAFWYTYHYILGKGETFEDRRVSDTEAEMICQDLEQVRERIGSPLL